MYRISAQAHRSWRTVRRTAYPLTFYLNENPIICAPNSRNERTANLVALRHLGLHFVAPVLQRTAAGGGSGNIFPALEI